MKLAINKSVHFGISEFFISEHIQLILQAGKLLVRDNVAPEPVS